MTFCLNAAGGANGKDTIAWTMQKATILGQKIPDVVKEYPWDHELVARIKRLISGMTSYNPKDRMALADVYREIQDVDKVKSHSYTIICLKITRHFL